MGIHVRLLADMAAQRRSKQGRADSSLNASMLLR